MRESRTFAERTSVFSSDATVRKYFLVYEGSDTEVLYFNAVDSMREDIEINPNPYPIFWHRSKLWQVIRM